MATRYYSPSRDLSDNAREAEALLFRYPEITETELAALIRTFAHLPLLDYGLLAADDRLGEKLEMFYHDHGEKLRAPIPLLAWGLALSAAFAVVLFAWAVA